jgi:hypothetical protein
LAADVVGVVDHGFDAQGTAVLEVLLGPGVSVEHVDGDAAGVPVDRGLEHPAGLAAALAPEDDLDVLGAAEVEVVGHEGFEEGSGVAGGVEHDGAGGFHLPHGQVPPEPGVAVGGGQRQRQPRGPAFEEHPDRAGAEPVADGPQGGGIVGRGEAVGQLGEPDPRLGRLPLGPFMGHWPIP